MCVCWQRQTVMLLPAAQPPEEKKRLSILFIVTLQDTERLSLHSNTPAHACKSWKWVWEWVLISRTAWKTDSDAHIVFWRIYLHLSLCVSDQSQVQSLALVFYLRVNRTGPQRMSTHHITNPAQKNNNSVFVSSSGSFFSPPHCFSHPPTALLPFLFIQQLLTALRFCHPEKAIRVMQCKSKPTLNIYTGRAKLGSPRRNLYLGLASGIGKRKQWQIPK